MFTVTVLEEGDVPPRGTRQVWGDNYPRLSEDLAEQLPEIRWTEGAEEAVVETIVDWLWGILPGPFCDGVYRVLQEHYRQDEERNPDGN